MNTDLFDKKIAELLEQNENRLPTFTNKESVWSDIERKLQKPGRVKLFRYAALVAAACIVPIVGFTFLYRTEQSEKEEAKSAKVVTQQVAGAESIQEVQENEQSDANNATIDYAEYKERKAEKSGKKNPIVSEPEKEMNAVAAVFNPVAEEKIAESSESIENIASGTNDLPVAEQRNDIRIRVSLSPGNRETRKNEKLKIRFGTYLTNYEENTSQKNIESNRTPGGFIRIPL